MLTRIVFSRNIRSWLIQNLMERLLKFSQQDNILFHKQFVLLKLQLDSKKNLLWLISGQSELQDHTLKSFKEKSLFLQAREYSMLCILLSWEELALFQVLLDAEKLVFLKLCLNTPTLNVLFMLVVEKEEMKWQKYLKNSQGLLHSSME